MILWHGNNYFDLGQIGVGLFMIISGYSLTASSEHISAKEFYKKRLLRIFPQFYISYIICMILLIACGNNLNFNVPSQNFIFTLIGFDGYLNYKIPTFYITGEWFLGAIISLYAIFPIIRICIYRHPIYTCIASLVVFLINSHYYSYLYDINEWNNIISMSVLFVFGGSARVVFTKYKLNSYLAIMAGGLIYLLFLRDSNIVLTKIISAIMAFTLVMFFFELKIASSMNSGLITKLAEVSFAIFLVHHVIIYIITGENFPLGNIKDNHLLFSLCLCASFIIGYACYKLNSLLFRKYSLPWLSRTL